MYRPFTLADKTALKRRLRGLQSRFGRLASIRNRTIIPRDGQAVGSSLHRLINPSHSYREVPVQIRHDTQCSLIRSKRYSGTRAMNGHIRECNVTHCHQAAALTAVSSPILRGTGTTGATQLYAVQTHRLSRYARLSAGGIIFSRTRTKQVSAYANQLEFRPWQT